MFFVSIEMLERMPEFLCVGILCGCGSPLWESTANGCRARVLMMKRMMNGADALVPSPVALSQV